jgi:hypothetical protein
MERNWQNLIWIPVVMWESSMTDLNSSPAIELRGGGASKAEATDDLELV